MKVQADVLYQRLGIVLLSITIGVLALYAYKLLSLIMPLLTILMLWHQGHLKELKMPNSPPLFLLLALIVLAGISIFWTTNTMAALKTFSAISMSYVFCTLFIAAILRADMETSRKSFHIFASSGYILISLILLQTIVTHYTIRPSHQSFTNFLMIKPTGSIIGLFSFICFGVFWCDNKKLLAGLSFILIACNIYLTGCNTAFFALLIGIMVFILTYLIPMLMTRLLMVGSYSVLLLSPLLYASIATPFGLSKIPYTSYILTKSFYHRMLVWDWYAKKFMTGSIFGSGLESGRAFSEEVPYIFAKYKMTVHAHNNSLQAYVELGFLGGIIYALLVSSFFYVVLRKVKDSLSMAVCNSTIVYALVEAQFTHNLWRNYWLSLLTIVAGLIILFIKIHEEKQRVQGDHLGLFQDHAWVWEQLKFWKK